MLTLALGIAAAVFTAFLLRRTLLRGERAGGERHRENDGSQAGEAAAAKVEAFTARIKPVSIIGLVATVVILFGFQGETLLQRPAVIAMIAVPLLIQAYGVFLLAYAAAWLWRTPFAIAAPAVNHHAVRRASVVCATP